MACRLLLFAVCFLLPGLPASGAPGGDFTTLTTRGKQLAAEKSWGLARDAFAAAAPLARDDTQRRWCAFWLADATWRAGDPGRGSFQARNKWRTKNVALLNTLLAPYTRGVPRDDLWAAIAESRASLERTSDYSDAGWNGRLEIADFFASAAPTAENAARHFEFLRRVVPELSDYVSRGLREKLLEHLRLTARMAPEADQRAWAGHAFAIRSSLRYGIGAEEADRQWEEARTATKGTAWESLTQVEEFIFRARRALDPTRGPDTPADLSALLPALAQHRDSLRDVPVALGPERTRRSLDDLERWWTDATVVLDAPAQLSPGTPVPFRFAATGLAEVTIELYRHTVETWFSRAADSRDVARAGVPTSTGSAINEVEHTRRNAERMQSITVAIPGAGRHVWHSEHRELAPLPPGFYSLLIHGDSAAGRFVGMRHLVVTGFAAVVIQSADRRMLQVSDAVTHEPITHRPVRGVAGVYGKPKPWSGTTDATGTVVMPIATREPEEAGGARICAFVQDQPVSLFIQPPREGPSRLAADLIFDRPLYRPGETVHWKIIVRDRQHGQFVVPTKKNFKLSVGVGNHRDVLVEGRKIILGPLGTADGSFVVPLTSRGGEAQVSLKSDDGAPNGSGAQLYSAFVVDNFAPPPINAQSRFLGEWRNLRPGSEILVEVEAQYFSGGPVPDAAVTAEFSVYGNPETISEIFERLRFKNWQDTLVKKQATRTDRNGKAIFRLGVPQRIPPDTKVHFMATVTQSEASSVETSTTLRLMEGGLRVISLSDASPLAIRPGERIEFHGRVIDGRELPAVFTGHARLIEKRWDEAWLDPTGRIVTGRELFAAMAKFNRGGEHGTLPPSWKKLHSGYAETPLEAFDISTGADGEFHVTVAPASAGIFQLRLFKGEIPLIGSEDGKSLTVVAADETTTALALPPRPVVLLGPRQLSPGEPLRLLLVTAEHARKGWVTIDGEETSHTQTFNLTRNVTWLTIDAPPAFAGSGHASAHVWTGPHSVGYNEIYFDYLDERGRLNVVVTPTSETARPGEETSARLRVTDSLGKPVSAELSVGVSDEAVNELIPHRISGTSQFWSYSAERRSSVAITEGPGDGDFTAPIRDPRPGAILNRTAKVDYADRLTSLHQFKLEIRSDGAGATGYAPVTPASMAEAQMFKIRRSFASTATWQPAIATNEKGEAEVTFRYPSNLTRWEFDAYAVGADGNTFGRAIGHARTSLPFQARLQSPRFLIEGDAARMSANLVNRSGSALKPRTRLEADGAAELTAPNSAEQSAPDAPVDGESRAAWFVRALSVGPATLRLFAQAGDERDAMEQKIPVLPNGLAQHHATSGRLAADARKLSLTLALPSPLDPQRTTTRVLVSSGYASAMLDALPYLIDYPYGCVEQTMSRFLPAVVARQTLTKLGFDAVAVEKRIMARETSSENTRRSKTAGLPKLDEVIQQSLARLAAAQLSEHSNDGYGWWPGQRTADEWMTAYVGWGLCLAREAGVTIEPDTIPRRALENACETLEPEDDRLPWTLLALARVAASATANDRARADSVARAAFARAFAARDRYSAAGRACLAAASVTLGSADQRAVLLRNLENGVQRTGTGKADTLVHWGATTGYWRATDGAVESTALTVLALLELDPRHGLIQPALDWLVLNRRGGNWQSTRDSAFALLALARALDVRGDSHPNAQVEVLVNRNSIARIELTRETLLAGATEIAIPARVLRGGENMLEIRRLGGNAPVNALVHGVSWARGDAVKPASHKITIRRSFDREQQQPALAGVRFTILALEPKGRLLAGEQLFARLGLEVSSPLEYVMVEAPKPAGCEPASALSGWDASIAPVSVEGEAENTGRAIYREEHDDRSVFFLDRIGAGKWEIRYALRATTPGDYQTLPAAVEAMYVPEIRANSDARRIFIDERHDD